MSVAIVHPGFAPVVPAPLLDARLQARTVLEQAREEVERLRQDALAAARAEAATVLEAARAEAAEEAARRVVEVEDWLAVRRGDLAPAVAEAALAVAERVWRTLPVDRSAAVAQVTREALEALTDRSAARVRVHPDDAGRLQSLGVPVEPDAGLAPGDCRIEAPEGAQDARAEVRARLALEAFAAALGRTAPERETLRQEPA